MTWKHHRRLCGRCDVLSHPLIYSRPVPIWKRASHKSIPFTFFSQAGATRNFAAALQKLAAGGRKKKSSPSHEFWKRRRAHLQRFITARRCNLGETERNHSPGSRQRRLPPSSDTQTTSPPPPTPRPRGPSVPFVRGNHLLCGSRP